MTEDEGLRLIGEPVGPDDKLIGELAATLPRHPELERVLRGAPARVLAFRPVDEAAKSAEPERFGAFHAVVYDYLRERTLSVSGPLAAADPGSPGPLEISDSADQPLPSRAEFQAAVDILRTDESLRADLDTRDWAVFRPMPPVVPYTGPDGHPERVLGIGLLAPDRERSRVVAVHMAKRRVLHELEERLPFASRGCEPARPDDSCSPTGSAGQLRLRVTRGGETLWELLVVRPAASSGTQGSGIELRNVRYRGKSVLYRAHVPILNIEYEPQTALNCGPTYRDWQNSEACFEANGDDWIPGFRHCTAPALTILDTGRDSGNFRGVAAYVLGDEVVLVSELQAGWYRYISQWRLRADGTIRPRFGFAATDNPCTCRPHRHHVYWRLDFDVHSPSRNVVEEYNDPPIMPDGAHWHTKRYEIRRPNDPLRNRRWRVRNTGSGASYTLVPGPDAGVADSYGVGDLWVLRYKPATSAVPGSGELDDGQGFTTRPQLSRAGLDAFLTPPEALFDLNGDPVDVVLWYTEHFHHDAAHAGGAVVGPDLVPGNW
ncbi:hypothetical protein [Actinomadura rupiterrae]|uniref:hypothetical protein n=1 Tax=Actinomadura rupiterrae TaxID=559627 RepID=UPI0020A36261|nr:hypothetical protein [Actinomadura rupiterrae]MCP2341527.1 hypothetical protein [Actinomadura rupiterrae]